MGKKSRNDPQVRFPGGESYYDVIAKLEPVIIDIEQQTAPVLIVSHISSIQIFLAYFLNMPVEEAMQVDVPLHTVIELSPQPGGRIHENRHQLLRCGSTS